MSVRESETEKRETGKEKETEKRERERERERERKRAPLSGMCTAIYHCSIRTVAYRALMYIPTMHYIGPCRNGTVPESGSQAMKLRENA